MKYLISLLVLTSLGFLTSSRKLRALSLHGIGQSAVYNEYQIEHGFKQAYGEVMEFETLNALFETPVYYIPDDVADKFPRPQWSWGNINFETFTTYG
jgi:hypothetical protein